MVITDIRKKKMVVRGYHLSCAGALDLQGMLIGGLFATLKRKDKKKTAHRATGAGNS
jgi:hypothetical protein